MNSVNIVFACIFLLILLAFTAVIVAGLNSGSRFRSLVRLVTSKPRLVRLICGISGVAVLAAVTAGTWQAMTLDYVRDPSGMADRFHVPTTSVSSPAKSDFFELARARLLIHLVAVEASPSGLKPKKVEHIDMQWLPDQQPLERNFWIEGYQFSYKFVITSVYYARTRATDKAPTLKIVVKHSYKLTDSTGKAVVEVADTKYGIGREGEKVKVADAKFSKGDLIDLFRIKPELGSAQPLLTLIPRSSPGNIHLLFYVTRVTDDDPLAHTSWAGFCQQWGKRGEEALRAEVREPWSGAHPDGLDKYASVRGMALVNRWGFTGLLLLVAAVLLTQLFSHRVLMFPAVLAVVVLYSAALDRAVLGVHLARLDDPRSSLATRMVACDRLGYTFFFRKSAIRRLEALTRDTRTPDEMRYLASSERRWLQADLPSFEMTPRFLVLGVRAINAPHAYEQVAPYAESSVTLVTTSGHAYAVALSPDGKSLAAGHENSVGDDSVTIWDMQTGRMRHSLTKLRTVRSVAFSPDGKTLAVAVGYRAYLNAEGQDMEGFAAVTLWDLQAKPPRLARTLTPGEVPEAVTFSPNGKMLLASGGKLELWDLVGGRPKTSAPRWSRAYYKIAGDRASRPVYSTPAPVFSPDGKTLALAAKINWRTVTRAQEEMFYADTGGAAELWDIPARPGSAPRLRRTLPTEFTRAMAFSPDGKSMSAVGRVDKGGMNVGSLIWMFDPRTGALRWSRATDAQVNCVPFSPDGKVLAITQDLGDTGGVKIGNRIELWDARTGKTLRRFDEIPTWARFKGVRTIAEAQVQPDRTQPPGRPGIDSSDAILFSPDNKTLVVLQGEEIRLIKLSDFSAAP